MKELKALDILKDIRLNYQTKYILNRKIQIDEAIVELEALDNQDKLAELEKVILNWHLAQGYQIGVGGWAFNVEIKSDYESKQLLIYLRENIDDHYTQVYRVETETTKEMFEKAIEFFNLWIFKILEVQQKQ